MNYYSDPTANRALSGINREFNRLEKKAKELCQQFREGKITQADLDRAQAQFTGIYRHVLTFALKETDEQAPADPKSAGACLLVTVFSAR